MGDANGILNVSAQDLKTKAKADCRIEGACKGIDPEEIARMVREAEDFAKEDQEYRKQSEMRTELESLCYDLEDSAAGKGKDKAKECLAWLQGLESLGKSSTGRTLERWLQDLHNL